MPNSAILRPGSFPVWARILGALSVVVLLTAAAASCGRKAKAPVRASRPANPPRAAKVAPRPEADPAVVPATSSPRPKAKKGGKKEIPIPTAATIPILNSSRLQVEPAPPAAGDAPPRNLFAFEEDPAVVAERKRQADLAAEQARLAAEEAEKRRREQEEYARLHPPPPQPPAITFEFLGYFGDPKNRMGVFAPKGGGEVTLAVEGDKIFGTFHVKEIGYESAEIGFDKFQETKRIPISASSGGK